MSKKYFKRKYDFNNIQADEFDQSVLEGDDFGFWRSAISIPVFIFVWIFMWSVLSFWGFILLIFGINAIKKVARKNKLRERAYRYYNLLKSRDSWTLDEVAYFMNIPAGDVKKDLQYLFDTGVITLKPETIIYESRENPKTAYDPQKMYSNASYTVNKVNENYKNDINGAKNTSGLRTYVVPGSYNNNLDLDKTKVKVETKIKDNELYSETMAYIRKIRAANDAIPGEAMSAKLDELENITLSIYNATVENEEFSRKTKKFMSYYLPTTERLVEKYAELDAKTIQTDNTRHIKDKIEEALETIIKAFYELYDSLYDYDAIDITSEIDAFKNTLANDGLIDNGMQIELPKETEKEKS